MRGMSIVAKVGLLAAVVGAASWLVVGIWHYNFVADIFGSGSTPSSGIGERIIYIVFGVGAIICLPLLAAALGSSRTSRLSCWAYCGRRSGPSTSAATASSTRSSWGLIPNTFAD